MLLIEECIKTLKKESLFMTDLSILDLFFDWFLNLLNAYSPYVSNESEMSNMYRVIMFDSLKYSIGSRLLVGERELFNKKCILYLEDSMKKIGILDHW